MNFIDKLVDRAESLADEVEILSVHAKYESVQWLSLPILQI